MSQIATAYVLTKPEFDDFVKSADEERWVEFWEELSLSELQPEFGYSGYVVIVLMTYLNEHGHAFPDGVLDRNKLGGLESIWLLTPESAADVARRYADLELDVDPEELKTYYEEFTEEEDEEAGEMMYEAIAYLKRICEEASKQNKYLMLQIG